MRKQQAEYRERIANLNEKVAVEIFENPEPVAILEKPEAQPAFNIPLPRTRVVEYLLRTNGNGEIVSQLGPCLCGAGKREWHQICLKEQNHG